MSRRIVILLNRRAGSVPDRTALARTLEGARLAADVMELPDAPRADRLMTVAAGYDVLVAAGGDGTVSAVAAAAVASHKTLGVIPAGTMNHFARDAGIPQELERAVALIADGRNRLVDVGTVNGRIFVNNGGLGAYPQMVWERNRVRERGLAKPLATALAVMDTWLELRDVTVRLCVDGRELVRRSPFVVVGNGEYELEGMQLGRRRTLTGGRLSLYVAPGLARLDALALPIRALVGKLKTHEKFEAWAGATVTVDTADAHAVVALDGEIERMETPLRFSVRPQALRVIALAPENS